MKICQAWPPKIKICFKVFLVLMASYQTLHSKTFITDRDRKIELKERELPYRYNECDLCHPKKERRFISKKIGTRIEHADKDAAHGKVQLECHQCHDINKSNYLLSSTNVEASWENSSGVCQRCHADRYRDWVMGAHGKRTGHWRGDVVQYHCIDCHDPHSVKFKKMDLEPIAKPSRFMIQKHPEEHSRGKE